MSRVSVQTKPVPRHVAVIMDGNGRWAKRQRLPRLKGHEEGAKSVRTIIRCCRDHGVEYLTLYAFSIENWIRPKTEVRGLMRILKKTLREQEVELHENEVRLQIIGRPQDLPSDVQTELKRVMKATAHYKRGHLILALSYGAREEITRAAREIARKAVRGDLKPSRIDEKTVAQHLYTSDIPDPDLLIRTSGELRISNFLLWQLSYTELYITDSYWPDFREDEFAAALEEYARRHRRYGDIK